MDTAIASGNTRYAKCIEASKKVRWDIDRDVIRGRKFDLERKYLPDRLSRITNFTFANAGERRLISQIQGRTYTNMFGLCERYIGMMVMDVTREQALGDQVVVESLVRFTDEELKHQELFRRLEVMIAATMPTGYSFVHNPNDVASLVLGKSRWAQLALTCHIELFTLDHYRQSIDKDSEVSELWKDVFLFHMREESQHAILDEMEWQREDAKLTATERDAALTDLIELVGAVDGILQAQSQADADYFIALNSRKLTVSEGNTLRDGLLRAYRWQYIVSGALNERFGTILAAMLSPAQMERVNAALEPLIAHAGTN
jgi:hypothetical protein